MSKKISVLAVKFIVGFIILGALICSISSSIGYYQYKTSMEQQYSTTAYNVAKQASSYLDKEQLSVCLDFIKRSINGEDVKDELKKISHTEEYKNVLKLYMDLRNSMEANDIFLVYVDKDVINSFDGNMERWNPLYYIFDSFSDEEKSYKLGESGPFNPKFVDTINLVIETGKRPNKNEYITSKSQFGYNTYAIEPVSVDGEVLVLGVEIPMKIIQSALRQYLIFAVCVSIFVLLIVISIYMAYLFKNVIKPINTIAVETGKFVDNGVKESTVITKIKTKDEIENLANNIIKMQGDINSYIENLTTITAEKERLGAELNVAKHIQASVLPCIFPAFPDRPEIEVFASMTPAKEVGGDFYDYFLVDENHLAMVIADVSGKGVPAALFMMISKTLIKSVAQTGISPKQILEKVNNQLCENNDAEMFVTVWIGIMDLTTGHMVCTNAGHEYPAIYRKNEGFELYHDKHGFVLAGMENVRYREYELQLNPGDIIYVYSDGVAEATDLNNCLYGTDRMIDALNACPNKTPKDIAVYVKQDVDAFAGEADQFDDITMLCVEFVGKNKI